MRSDNIIKLSDKNIQSWEDKFGIKIPTDYALFSQLINGKIFYDGIKEIQFLLINESIEFYEEYCFFNYCKNAIPISLDGKGNFCVYKIDDNKCNGIWIMSAGNLNWDDSRRIAENISELINLIQPLDNYLN